MATDTALNACLSVRLLVEVHGNEEATAAAAELELERRTIAAVNFRLDHQYCKHEVRANERFFHLTKVVYCARIGPSGCHNIDVVRRAVRETAIIAAGRRLS